MVAPEDVYDSAEMLLRIINGLARAGAGDELITNLFGACAEDVTSVWVIRLYAPPKTPTPIRVPVAFVRCAVRYLKDWIVLRINPPSLATEYGRSIGDSFVYLVKSIRYTRYEIDWSFVRGNMYGIGIGIELRN